MAILRCSPGPMAAGGPGGPGEVPGKSDENRADAKDLRFLVKSSPK